MFVHADGAPLAISTTRRATPVLMRRSSRRCRFTSCLEKCGACAVEGRGLETGRDAPIMVAITPKTRARMLDAVLLGKTRSAVLRELFLNPDRRLSFNELVRRVKSGDGAVARELRTLIEAGLIAEQREGNQRFLSARRESPVFVELKAFIAKTSGAPCGRGQTSRTPEAHRSSHMLDDVARILSLTPEDRLRELSNAARFFAAAQRPDHGRIRS
jgi:DNA-binding transcriptional ArsR family regulator